MTLLETLAELERMVDGKAEVDIHVDIQSRNRRGTLTRTIELTAWGSRNGTSSRVESETGEQLVEQFRVQVLPAIGLGPDVPDVDERLKALDCDIRIGGGNAQ